MNLHLRSILSSKENRDLNRGFVLAVSLITLFFACLPLFTVNCIQGHDIDYHLLRIEALKTGILNGLPFLRVNMLFFGGEGYASSLFYPDFLLYIPALLRAAGVGINLSFHIFVGFCIIAAFVSMYLSVYYITERSTSALIAATAYTLCQYHIDDIYTRAAVGEYTAFIFLPLIAAGLFDLSERDFKKPWLLIAGMSGVLLCHTLSTVFCIILCICYVLIHIKGLIGKPVKLFILMAAALLTLLLTAFYWLPFVEQIRSTEFKYKIAKFDVGYEKLLIREIFENKVGRMGIALIILLFAALLIRHAGDRIVRFADFMLAAGMIFMLCTTGFFPWKRLERYVMSVQFPWRLFIMASLLFSVAAGIYIEKAAGERKKLAVIAVLALMTVSAVCNINRTEEGYYSYSDDYYDMTEYTCTVIGGEWLPLTVEKRGKLGKFSGYAFDDKGEKREVGRRKNTLTVNAAGSEYLDVPFVYYTGYTAVDEKGQRLIIDGSGDNGRIRVYTSGAESVYVYYAGTPLQKAADIISLLTLIVTAVLVILRNKHYSGRREGH